MKTLNQEQLFFVGGANDEAQDTAPSCEEVACEIQSQEPEFVQTSGVLLAYSCN